MYVIRTFLLAEFGFYAYHRFFEHIIPNRLHGEHHDKIHESEQSLRWDELRGSCAMVLGHIVSPLRINTVVYYSYMGFLLGIHRACHLEGVHLMSFHRSYHKEHHNNPDVNFALVTPLMDLLFDTCHSSYYPKFT